MNKDLTIIVRISEENKETIRAAAELGGKSLTRFITDAALKQARDVARHPAPQGAHRAVPTFFRALCFEAAQGGSNGYLRAGLGLAGALGSQQPYDLDADDWAREVDALLALLDAPVAARDDEQVWAWFQRHYSKAMALVPPRRRWQFVEGVRKAREDDRIAL